MFRQIKKGENRDQRKEIEGATALAEALKVNKTLTELELSWKKISDKHKEVLKSLPRCKSNALRITFY